MFEIEEFKKRYEDACANWREANEKERIARAAYEESRRVRASHIEEKIKALQADISAEESANALRPQQMADALGAGNDKLADEVDSEINAADERIAALKRKKELFVNTAPKGDQDLFDEAVRLHREKRKAYFEYHEQLSKLSNDLSEIISSLEDINGDTKRDMNYQGYLRADTKMIAMVEAHEGVIDVTGGSAGCEEDAKQRYVCGIIAGLENTPAGKKLAAKLAAEAAK